MSKYNLREYNFTVYDNIPLYWVSRLVVLMVCCYSQILHWIERSPLAFCSLNPGAKFFEKCDKSFQITKKILTSKYVTPNFTQCGIVWINSHGQVILHVTDYYSLYQYLMIHFSNYYMFINEDNNMSQKRGNFTLFGTNVL